jgi:hypothetical protein
MSAYRSILAEISRGRPIDAVREELDLREDVLDAMIQSMLREGYLDEFGCEGDTCTACPMSGSCPMATIQGPTSYLVTEAGKQYVLEAQQASD